MSPFHGTRILLQMGFRTCISYSDRGGSSTGAVGAFAPAEIWQRVQCTRPEKDQESLKLTDL